MGRRTPVVPMIDKPPSIPRTGFSVFFASSRPPGIDMMTLNAASAPAIFCIVSIINLRGPGLIDGSPGGTDSPFLVTVPIPSPAKKCMPAPSSICSTDVNTDTPSVISGSSLLLTLSNVHFFLSFLSQ